MEIGQNFKKLIILIANKQNNGYKLMAFASKVEIFI